MAREENAGGFEWVNAWAAPALPAAVSAQALPATAPVATPIRFTVTGPAEATTLVPDTDGASRVAVPPDQLMRDIAEIERARDALAGGGIGRQIRAFMLVPSRSPDATPLMIGAILALAMLTVFGAAAAMSKFTVR